MHYLIKRRLTLGQLKGETAIGPNIHFFSIRFSCEYFWRHPRYCTNLSPSILFFFRQLYRETQVSNFDRSISFKQNIVWFDIAMQHIFLMKSCYTLRNAEQSVLAELFAEFVINSLRHIQYLGELASWHVLYKHPDLLLKVIYLFAPEYVGTVDIFH